MLGLAKQFSSPSCQQAFEYVHRGAAAVSRPDIGGSCNLCCSIPSQNVAFAGHATVAHSVAEFNSVSCRPVQATLTLCKCLNAHRYVRLYVLVFIPAYLRQA